MDKNEMRKKLNVINFISNNGRVLRMINILHYQYNELKSIANVLKEDGIDEAEFLDSVNYLVEAKYIRLREISSKIHVEELSQDTDYKKLEAKLNAKGITLLAGGLEDNCIEV